MNGVHDMGGTDGFGPVVVERAEPVFHADWERRVFGMVLGRVAAGLAGTDAFRFAIERMDPRHYLAATYYERWMTALATMLVEAGRVSADELARRAGSFPLSRAADEVRIPEQERVGGEPRFRIGSAVVVRNEHPFGHTRCPRYVRGKRGTVVRADGLFRLPDVVAHVRRPCDEPAYGVRFAARELWGHGAEDGVAVHVDLWESYLDPA
ncbi:MAG TPA: nitrile hydratase subunit beta [Candidatus Binatia bacterium]|nr:nitrile hydratase subunit beta [Candidatus Binatia bacterium]